MSNLINEKSWNELPPCDLHTDIYWSLLICCNTRSDGGLLNNHVKMTYSSSPKALMKNEGGSIWSPSSGFCVLIQKLAIKWRRVLADWKEGLGNWLMGLWSLSLLMVLRKTSFSIWKDERTVSRIIPYNFFSLISFLWVFFLGGGGWYWYINCWIDMMNTLKLCVYLVKTVSFFLSLGQGRPTLGLWSA